MEYKVDRIKGFAGTSETAFLSFYYAVVEKGKKYGKTPTKQQARSWFDGNTVPKEYERIIALAQGHSVDDYYDAPTDRR